MANDFNFDDRWGAKGFKVWLEENEKVNRKVPHTSEAFFNKDFTTEENVQYFIDNFEISRLGALGAVDTPTPLRGYKGKERRKEDFPYFVEGVDSTQDESAKVQRLLTKISGTPSQTFLNQIIGTIYTRVNEVVDGMKDVAEFMRMNMLQNGHFLLQNAEEYGNPVTDLYNYDIDGSWSANNIELLTGNDAWNDTTNSNPIDDILRYDRKLRLLGGRVEAIMATSATLNMMYANKKVINYMTIQAIVNPNYVVSKQDFENILEQRAGHKIAIIANDEIYRGWDNQAHNYMQPNRVVIIGTPTIGTTWSGLTYEELFNKTNGKNGYDSQSIVDDHIVVSEYLKVDPDRKVMRVSRSVIPSFEGIKKVFNLVWIDTNTQWTITYDVNGGSGKSFVAQGVNKTDKMGYVAVGQGLTNSGKRFVGWNTSAAGTGDVVDRNYVPTADTTVYAIYA